MKLLTGLRFKLGFVLIFSFSHYPFSFSVLAPLSPFPFPRSPFLVLRSSFPVPRSSFPVPRSSFSVLRSPFPVSHSVFPFSRSSFLLSYSLFLVLVKSLRSFRKSECSSHYRVVFFVLFCFALPASQCHGRYVEGLHAWRAFTSCREPGRVIIILPLFPRILKQD